MPISTQDWFDTLRNDQKKQMVLRAMCRKAKQIWRTILEPSYTPTEKDKIAVEFASELLQGMGEYNSRFLQQVLLSVMDEIEDVDDEDEIRAKVSEAVDLGIEARWLRIK